MLRAELEVYREQGMQLVRNALRMQDAVERLERELDEVRRIREQLGALELRVEALSRIVDGLTSRRKPARPRGIPRIFAEDVG